MAQTPDDEVLTRRAGWGLFRLPGEKRRIREATEKAKRIWKMVNK